jgi:hypothetical protein
MRGTEGRVENDLGVLRLRAQDRERGVKTRRSAMG